MSINDVQIYPQVSEYIGIYTGNAQCTHKKAGRKAAKKSPRLPPIRNIL